MFQLSMPWALGLLVLPPLIWYFMPRASQQLMTALKVPFFAAMMQIAEQDKKSVSATTSLLYPALIWVALVLALTGPRWIGEPQPLTREGYNIMMALDLSGSMELEDMLWRNQPVSRLAVVKHAAKGFVQDRAGDKIGLILFGTRAYLQTPLTYDRHNVLLRIDDASVGLAGQTTSIGDAVGLAVKRLEGVPKKGKIIILLTDGANNSGVLQPLKAAELAKSDGIKIYTIGLGSEVDPNALQATNPFGLNVSADLDEDTLKKMADMTDGVYFRATDTETLHQIYQTINQLETVDHEMASVRPEKDYYPWCVGFALLLSFYWFLGRHYPLGKFLKWGARHG